MNYRKPGCNIFLIGFMGAGKTTVAAALSRMLNIPAVEMDQLIVESEGMAISEIFARFGEDHFRDIESATLLKLEGHKDTIISCGGGIVLRPENAEYMKKSGRAVLLSATPETIYERVKDSTDRPVLNNNMNIPYISALLEKRRERYENAADITIATDGKNVNDICLEIIEKLSASGAFQEK